MWVVVVEGVVGDVFDQVGYVVWNCGQGLVVWCVVGNWDCGYQVVGIGVYWVGEDVICRVFFDDFVGIYDGYVICDCCDYVQIMGNQ